MAALNSERLEEWVQAVVEDQESQGFAAIPVVVESNGVVTHLVLTRAEKKTAIDKKHNGRFRVLRYEDLKNQAPMKWLIKGVLPQAELAVVFGEPGSGKSFLAFDMACAIERGEPWGHSELCIKQGRTFYIFAEGGAGARGRFMAYAQKHGDGPLPGAIIDVPNLLKDVDGQVIVDRVDDEGGADLIVIDTLAASMPGGDENTGKDMGKVVDECKLIHRETGALVVLIHHSGKDSSKGARGWSGLKAAADAELEVTRNGDYRNVTVSKMKDGSDGAQFSFKLETVALGIDEYDGHPTIKAALQILPHVFTRPGELRLAKWREFDFSANRWIIPAARMKMDRNHVVPMSTQVQVLFWDQHLASDNGPDSFVFPSVTHSDRPISENTINLALRRLGYDTAREHTAHGFRKTASTLLNEAGKDREVIELCLAHGDPDKIRAAYNFAEMMQDRTDLMQWWSEYLDALRKNRPT